MLQIIKYFPSCEKGCCDSALSQVEPQRMADGGKATANEAQEKRELRLFSPI